jgi:hypothetical protein
MEANASETAAASWFTIAASACGTDHTRNGIGKQDAVARHPVGDRWIIAIADGAGSAPKSAEGAALAVEVATQSLEQCLLAADGGTLDAESAIVAAMMTAKIRLDQLASERSVRVSDFHTTLALCLIDDRRVMAAQVGDALLISANEDGELRPLIRPQKGEYANETRFLTSVQAHEEIELACHDQVEGLVAMTDGLLRLAARVPGYDPHPAFCTPLLMFARTIGEESQGCEELGAFLRSPRVQSRTDDDLTLVIAVRNGST